MKLLPEDPRKRRLVLISGVGISALVLAAIVLFVVLAEPGPEDVADDYLQALQTKDYDKAYGLLTTESQKSVVKPSGLEQTSTGAFFSKGLATGFTLREVAKEKNRAVLEATLAVGGSPVPVKIVAVKEKTGWRIET